MDDALYALASFSSSLLPCPTESNDKDLNRIRTKLFGNLDSEIRGHLGLPNNDESPKAKSLIFEFLQKEMRQYSFSQKNIDSIKSRLGQKGLLRLDYYKVEFTKAFRNSSSKRGVRPNHVLNAISSPNSVQHFRHGVAFTEGEAMVSLFVAKQNVGKNNNFYLLVQAERKGASLLVNNAWRIYESDVAYINDMTPLGILKSFIDTYGVNFGIGNSAYKKLFLEETVDPVTAEVGRGVFVIDPLDLSEETFYESSSIVSRSITGVWEVSLAYMINVSKYVNDLKKHNVQAEL